MLFKLSSELEVVQYYRKSENKIDIIANVKYLRFGRRF